MKARFLLLPDAPAGPVRPAAAPAAQIGPVSSPTGPVMAGPYLVVDAATGETLLQRDPGAPWYPASLTKLMTMYIVFEEMKAGRLQPGDPVVLSKHAESVEYAGHLGPVGSTITVDHRAHLPGREVAERRRRGARREGLGLGARLRPAHERDGQAPRHDGDALRQRPRPAQSRPGDDGARPRRAGGRAGAGLPAVLRLLPRRPPRHRQPATSRAA